MLELEGNPNIRKRETGNRDLECETANRKLETTNWKAGFQNQNKSFKFAKVILHNFCLYKIRGQVKKTSELTFLHKNSPSVEIRTTITLSEG